MADAPKADLHERHAYTMKHRSGQITFQSCQTCHPARSRKRATHADSPPTLWQTGASTPASRRSRAPASTATRSRRPPRTPTQSSCRVHAGGGRTASNQAPVDEPRLEPYVAGKDCAACHAADAKTTGSAWSKADLFHAAVAGASTCKECHGLTNGGGSAAGTNNNLPAGLTSSTTITTARRRRHRRPGRARTTRSTTPTSTSTAHDCNFCHTQVGVSTAAGIAAARSGRRRSSTRASTPPTRW